MKELFIGYGGGRIFRTIAIGVFLMGSVRQGASGDCRGAPVDPLGCRRGSLR
ncbi:MAG: hypothetical protein ACYDAM_03480 [Leptospirales bacterium]